MKGNLQFEFQTDKDKNTITIRREFAAERQLVWDAYTKTELLDRWFAPKPLTTKTKSMDFSDGGHWIYAMIEPNGTEYWSRTDYVTIQPIDYYTALDAFCDNEGNINPELPRAEWMVSFEDLGEHSLVQTVVKYNSLSDLEAVLQMGMQDGLTSTLERLDELIIVLTEK